MIDDTAFFLTKANGLRPKVNRLAGLNFAHGQQWIFYYTKFALIKILMARLQPLFSQNMQIVIDCANRQGHENTCCRNANLSLSRSGVEINGLERF